jgi:uncharacterized lipoprotein YehR (DUF1307 family)
MKTLSKLLFPLLAMIMVASLFACAPAAPTEVAPEATEAPTSEEASAVTP